MTTPLHIGFIPLVDAAALIIAGATITGLTFPRAP